MEKKTQQYNLAEEALSLYKKEQEAFENHILWQELGMTPKEFFSSIKKQVDELQIDQRVWQRLYQQVKQENETRFRERHRVYEQTDFNKRKGLSL